MTVAANKAESLACMDRARDSIKIGDAVKARRYLEKAKRLDPQQDISYLLKKVESMETSSESSSKDSEDRSYAHDDHYEEPGLRSRKPAKPTPRPAQSPPNSKPEKEKRARSTSRTPKLGVDYTKEQLELVERIRNCKDYYEILKVSKTASEAEIKKEYRKMALQLHPDKCRAPHATEAFKALGNAYAILSDTEKRRQYDLYGADSVSNGPATSRRRDDFFQYDYGHGFEAEYTPEEIFNMFFGGGHPSDNLNRRRQRFNGHAHREEMHNQNENFHGPLIQLLPIILILFLGLVAQLMVGDPPFSLTQSSKYPIKRLTAELKVPYYVRQDFIQSHAGRIKQIENQVEDDHINNLRINCYKEQNQKETLLYRARWQRDEELMMRAQRMATPSCDQLKNIYGR